MSFSVTLCLIVLSLGLIKPETIISARPDGSQASGILPSLPTIQCWGDRYLQPCWAFYLAVGDLESGLHAGTNTLTH